MPAAMAAPVQRNMTVTPNQRSIMLPTGPAGPRVRSSSQPITTGGRTRGRWTAASSSSLPGKRQRARIQARAKAKGRVKSIAAKLTFRDSWTISHSSGLKMVTVNAFQSRSGGRSPCRVETGESGEMPLLLDGWSGLTAPADR